MTKQERTGPWIKMEIDDLCDRAGIEWEDAENAILDECTEDEEIDYNLFMARRCGII